MDYRMPFIKVSNYSSKDVVIKIYGEEDMMVTNPDNTITIPPGTVSGDERQSDLALTFGEGNIVYINDGGPDENVVTVCRSPSLHKHTQKPSNTSHRRSHLARHLLLLIVPQSLIMVSQYIDAILQQKL